MTDFLKIGADGHPEAAAESGGGGDVVDDTTPQLGGDLDTNSFFIDFDTSHGIRDENANEHIVFFTTASAVNQLGVTNGATGAGPTISANGDDAAVELRFGPKGAAAIKALSSIKIAESASAIGTSEGGYGQIWVKNEAPNELWFEDDAGGNMRVGAMPQFKRLSGDVTIDTGSFQDVTGLTFSVDANQRYLIEVHGTYTTDSVLNICQFGVNGPSSPTDLVNEVQQNINSAAIQGNTKYAYDSAFLPAFAPGATERQFNMWVDFNNGANSGTLAIRAKSETGSTVATIKAGTVLYWKAIG